MTRYLLAIAWGVLALGKIVDAGGLRVYLADSLGMTTAFAHAGVVLVIGLEVAAAALLLLGGWKPSLAKAGCVLSLGLAVTFLGASLSVDASDCGCFGAIATATRTRRILVSTILLCLTAATLRGLLSPQGQARERAWSALTGAACIAIVLAFWGSEAPGSGGETRTLHDLPAAVSSTGGSPPSRAPELAARPRPAPAPSVSPEVADPVTGGLWVRGRVVDAVTGDRIVGARAMIAAVGDDLASTLGGTRTDEEGLFRLSVVDSAPVQLIVMKDGYATARVLADPPLGSGGAASQSVRLEKGDRIRARVVDATGRPVSGADVWCVWTRAPFAWPRAPNLVSTSVDGCGAHARTDGDGYCELWGLKNYTYDVHCSHQAYRRVTPGASVAKPSVDSVVVLKMIAVVDLNLEMLNARTRQPVSLRGGTVDMPEFRGVRPGPMIREQRWGDRGPASLGGADGGGTIQMSFSVEKGADEGSLSVTLLVDLPGYERRRERITLRSGRPNSFTLELEPLAAGRRSDVVFRLTSPAGRAFDGRLTVSVKHSTDRTPMRHSLGFRRGVAAEALSLPLGLCAVWLTPGDAKTAFWTPMVGPLKLEVSATSGSQLVDLPVRGSPVRLRVKAADGRRVRGYSLLVEGGGARVGYTDGRDLPGVAQGDIVWLSPGTVGIRVHDPVRGLARFEIEVPSDGKLLERTATLDPRKAFDPSKARAGLQSAGRAFRKR